MFSHLHVHTVYSLLDGLVTPSNMVKEAIKKGFKALAITDHGSISGAIKFYKECRKENIKPIIGIEAYYVPDVSVKEKGEKKYHIVLLAKNNNGFKSLCKLMTKANTEEAFYYKPRIDTAMLLDTEDLIVTTACSYGIIAHPNYKRILSVFKEKFKDDLYLEIMPFGFDQQIKVNNIIIDLVYDKFGVKVIATNDIHYLNAGDEKTHNFLLNVNSGGRMEFKMDGLYMRTEEEMLCKFINLGYEELLIKTILNNTQEIVDKVNIELEEKDIELPIITTGDPFEVLKSKFDSFTLSQEYKDRLDYELGIIRDKGFASYFLMVEDFISFCVRQGWELGAGRGSGAGSLMNYLLGITDVDPIKDGLMFERFLNPERTDWPDLDLDVPRSKRQEAIQYLKDTYGHERVAGLSTVAELKLKSAFKDVAKAFGVPFMDANNIGKLIDNDTSLSELDDDSQLQSSIRALPQGQEILDMVQGISGTLRQSGTHAAGIVIAPQPITEFGVLERRSNDLCLNWDMDDIIFFGLVKLDVLGLRTLDIIGEVKKLIRERHKIDINWKQVIIDTPEILDEFGLGNTVGIFQFESGGMTRLVKQLRDITSKQILVDCNALGRPGPLDSGLTELYIQRHRGDDVSYNEPYVQWLFDHDIAADTYRVIIYQEQIIEILQKLAGYSIPQADLIRRIFAKKKGDMGEHEGEFINGCYKTCGMPEDASRTLFEALKMFSRYGFNKSHAAAYTELGLRQQYLKVNYPLEYMTALYKWTEEKDKISKFVDESHRLRIDIIPPDINTSNEDFTIEGESIRIGLSSIKGLGDKALEKILEERILNGNFHNLEDFRLRLPKSKVNKTVIRNLVLTGCFDSFGVNKKQFIQNEDLLHEIYGGKKKSINGQRKTLLELIHSESDDYEIQEEEIHKVSLMEGVYKADIEPRAELALDMDKLYLLSDYVRECQSCSLRRFYNCPVPMEYYPTSKIMIVGEFPGQEETLWGRGIRAFDKIDELCEKHCITREDFYLTNVYKCRPKDNRLPQDPPKDCYLFLKKEILITKPKIIVALGGNALEFFTGQRNGITVKSQTLKFHMEVIDDRLIVPVIYGLNPASLYFDETGEKRELLEEVFEEVSKVFYK